MVRPPPGGRRAAPLVAALAAAVLAAAGVSGCTDRGSGVGTEGAVDGPERGSGPSLSDGPVGGAADGADNDTADDTAPVVTARASGPRGHRGWFVGDVRVAWTIEEEESPASLTTVGCSPFAFTVTEDQTAATAYRCAASSEGGSARRTLRVARDATPPTRVSGMAERPPDRLGWYNAPVTVHYSGTDATSGIQLCSSPRYDTGDGRSVTVFGWCTDRAGNTTTTPTSFHYDATAPTLSPTVSPDPVVSGGPVRVAAGAADAMSDVDSVECGAVSSARPGRASVTCSATDFAGNSASTTVEYVVQPRGG